MPKICYKDKRFQAKTRGLIDTADGIIEEYAAQGFDLTLRALYHQFVSRDLLANTVRNYNMLGAVINDARLAGLIDWDRIVDSTRGLDGNHHWSSPRELIELYADGAYHIDKWVGQESHVEVWIEKDALKGIISDVCRELDVSYFSCRGYVSQSEMWKAGALRLSHYDKSVILHLGDHDPSGVDMTRDIRERLELFTCADVRVKRIALNMDQIIEYRPPPNPAKVTDSRAPGYISKYGRNSWELDALEPSVMVDLIRHEVQTLRDDYEWENMVTVEQNQRQLLHDIARGLEDD